MDKKSPIAPEFNKKLKEYSKSIQTLESKRYGDVITKQATELFEIKEELYNKIMELYNERNDMQETSDYIGALYSLFFIICKKGT